VLPPPVAATRTAVREALRDLDPSVPALVGCSGGADSTALAAATAFVCARAGRPAGLVTVDHQLQPGSADRAAQVAELGRRLGLEPCLVQTVDVAPAAAGGPEAAAREARYAALDAAAGSFGGSSAAAVLLLGHTLDDQAETVLLGLGRGAGPRSLAGMRPQVPAIPGHAVRVRPFLGLTRALTRQACEAQALPVWDDPHNAEPRFRRVRIRHEALPMLDDVLGGGVAAALARTARLVQDDVDALDGLAAEALAPRRQPDGSLLLAPEDGPVLRELPRALRTRILRAWLAAAGQPALSYAHLDDLDRLVTQWHGQRFVCLPGGAEVVRRSGRLHLEPPPHQPTQ